MDNNKNQKIITIVSFLFIVLVIILVIWEYQKQQTLLGEDKTTKQESELLITKLKPESSKDIKKLEEIMSWPLFNLPVDKNSGIREIICTINQANQSSYIGSFDCSNFSAAKTKLIPGKYTVIAVVLNDLLSKFNPNYSLEEEYYFCSIIQPFWLDPLFINSKEVFSFPEGHVYCSTGLKMKETQGMYWSGIVPDADSFSFKVYLVDKDIKEQVRKIDSFQSILNLLQDQQLIWEREKAISIN